MKDGWIGRSLDEWEKRFVVAEGGESRGRGQERKEEKEEKEGGWGLKWKRCSQMKRESKPEKRRDV